MSTNQKHRKKRKSTSRWMDSSLIRLDKRRGAVESVDEGVAEVEEGEKTVVRGVVGHVSKDAVRDVMKDAARDALKTGVRVGVAVDYHEVAVDAVLLGEVAVDLAAGPRTSTATTRRLSLLSVPEAIIVISLLLANPIPCLSAPSIPRIPLCCADIPRNHH